jgi:hypothetical protein
MLGKSRRRRGSLVLLPAKVGPGVSLQFVPRRQSSLITNLLPSHPTCPKGTRRMNEDNSWPPKEMFRMLGLIKSPAG